MTLTAEQVAEYENNGYLLPIDIFSSDEASQFRTELEAIEKRASNSPEQNAAIRNDSNWVVPFFDELTRTPAIVDAVSSILGPDVLVLSVDLFIKEAKTKKFISWHQDLHYWGLDSDEEVTAWLALSPATPESGCMRYLPGSHKTIAEHKDTFADSNMLSRGQEIAVEVDESKTVYVELQPGQMSLHHGRMFHASTANRSDDRRIGIAMRFVTPAMSRAKQGDKLGAMLVRGEDRFGNFELAERPKAEFEPAAMATWKRLRAVKENVLFDGIEQAS